MSISIMQPYVFPYIGYFQLIYASDVFVFYDDVNFINRGWINRNRILINGKDHLFTIPCLDASQNKLIKDIEVLNNTKDIKKLLDTIQSAYKKAPQFNTVFQIIQHILEIKENATISELAIKSILLIAEYLELKRNFKVSSEQYTNQELKKADRLIDICRLEGIEHYINASGGKAIYTKEYYKNYGINLDFRIPEKYEYLQFKNEFLPWLSIIDILMFNDKNTIINKILPAYHLE